ncbi:UNKNOWN [Stylonychia lemnae]|uniref:Uncharacterized protein n=1 Tax=Stylonychia lemnae TaxID=5949 RepID=A0A078AKV0_STYLE|nr:UNKNOWN [Stylonychia lemnae]|eukprot:CDW82072.1 UNKNOWN [Stylonychia lemnae]
MWLLVKELDGNIPLTIEYTQRYKIALNNKRQLLYSIGDSATIMLDLSTIAVPGKWFMIFQMANTEGQFSKINVAYKEAGINGLSSISKIIERPWNYKGDPNTILLQFLITSYSNTKIFIRDLQYWKTSLSFDFYIANRLYTALDPVKMQSKGLIAYFKMDESGGNYVYNHALLESFQSVSQPYFSIEINYRWYFYSDLNADPYSNSQEDMKFLFCKEPYSRLLDNHCDYFDSCHSDTPTDDCLGPEYSDISTCINLDQIYSLDDKECYDCHPFCINCNLPYQADACISCIPGYFKVNGICSSQCPDNTFQVNEECIYVERIISMLVLHVLTNPIIFQKTFRSVLNIHQILSFMIISPSNFKTAILCAKDALKMTNTVALNVQRMQHYQHLIIATILHA